MQTTNEIMNYNSKQSGIRSDVIFVRSACERASVLQLSIAKKSNIFRSGTDPILVVLVLVGAKVFQNSLRRRRFKLDRDEIWQECSSRKYASIDRVGFSI